MAWPSIRQWADAGEWTCAAVASLASAFAALLEAEKRAAPSAAAALLGVGTITAKSLSKYFERREKDAETSKKETVGKRVAKEILASLRSEYFPEIASEIPKHRATLYMAEQKPGKIKKLRIFCREGIYERSTTSWIIDDDDEAGCRGVAGKVWFFRSTYTIEAACDWPTPNDPQAPERKKSYAESLGMSLQEAEDLNVKSRSFTGAPITVRGRQWGVLLLDSLKAGMVDEKPKRKGVLNCFANLLGGVLSEVES